MDNGHDNIVPQSAGLFVCLFRLGAGVRSLTDSPRELIHLETDLSGVLGDQP